VLTRNTNIGYVLYPGGADMMDYFFELLCLKQTFKIHMTLSENAFSFVEEKYLLPKGILFNILRHQEIIDETGEITDKFKPRNPKIYSENNILFGKNLEKEIIKVLIDSQNVPILLVGSKHYKPWLEYFQKSIITAKAARRDDLKLFEITDNYQTIFDRINNYKRFFG
jgi:hypothetical protein